MVTSMNTTQTIFKSIDIHSHIVYGVDHGSKSLEQSLKLLEEAKKYGVSGIICTSHHPKGDSYSYKSNFKAISKHAKKLGVELYPGNEILLNNDTLDDIIDKKINTLNNSDYLLVEFIYRFSRFFKVGDIFRHIFRQVRQRRV